MNNTVNLETSKAIRVVYESYDYNMFKIMKGNRKTNATNINSLVVSMGEQQLMIPIIVNENFEIIDGQHRFNACRLLNLPIHYLINEGYGINEVVRANVNGGRKWYDNDYLNRYIELDDEKYVEIKNVIDDYGISATDVIKLLSKVNNRKEIEMKISFREGKIDIDKIDVIKQFLEDLQLFKEFKAFKATAFINAFVRLYVRADYNHKLMITKFRQHASNLTLQRTSDDYLSVLCNKIYSAGANKNPIFYSVESKRFHK